MKTKLAYALVSLIASCAFASEEVVILDNEMIATHHQPSDTPKASVLMVHGWAGQMNEVGDFYKRLASLLADQNIASLRINIRGESEQAATNYTLTSTFSSRVTDAKTGLSFLKQTYPDIKTGVVGFSLGGATAIALAGEKNNEIDSLVLWSSADTPAEVVKNLLDAQQTKQLEEGNNVVMNAWVDITITPQHFKGFFVSDIFPSFGAYSGALMTIRGTEDYLPDIDRKILDVAAGDIEESRYISGADHIFNVLDPNETYDDRVLHQTIQWFIDTLENDSD